MQHVLSDRTLPSVLRDPAAEFAIASEKLIAQVAAGLGINEKTLGRWVTVRKKELAARPRRLRPRPRATR